MRRTVKSLILIMLLLTAVQVRGDMLTFDAVDGFGGLGATAPLTLRGEDCYMADIEQPIFNEVTLLALVQSRNQAKLCGMQFVCTDAEGDTLRVSVELRRPGVHDDLGTDVLGVNLTLPGHTFALPTATLPAHGNSHYFDTPTTLALQLNPGGEPGVLRLILEYGDNAPLLISELTDCEPLTHYLTDSYIARAGYAALPGATTELLRAYIDFTGENDDDRLTMLDLSSIRTRLASSRDPVEGYWQVLDFNTDDTMLCPGGRYICAMLSTPGGYRLLYLSGAEINADSWRPGMVKARLMATGMPGAYDAVWYDAEGQPIDLDCAVQIDTPRVLTVQFPRMYSTLRMHKIAAPSQF